MKSPRGDRTAKGCRRRVTFRPPDLHVEIEGGGQLVSGGPSWATRNLHVEIGRAQIAVGALASDWRISTWRSRRGQPRADGPRWARRNLLGKAGSEWVALGGLASAFRISTWESRWCRALSVGLPSLFRSSTWISWRAPVNGERGIRAAEESPRGDPESQGPQGSRRRCL